MKTTTNDERRGLVQSEEESGVRSHDFAKDVNHADTDNAVINTTETDHAVKDADVDTTVTGNASSLSILATPCFTWNI